MAAGYRVTGATVASRGSPRADLRSARSHRHIDFFFNNRFRSREIFFFRSDGNAVEDVRNANVRERKRQRRYDGAFLQSGRQAKRDREKLYV